MTLPVSYTVNFKSWIYIKKRITSELQSNKNTTLKYLVILRLSVFPFFHLTDIALFTV